MELKRKPQTFKQGIDIKLLIDEKSDPIVQEATCAICLNLALNPKHCKPCGKLFCGGCIDEWLKKSPKCPNCLEENNFEPPPRMIMNLLTKVRVKCHFQKCSKTLLYSEFLSHVDTCDFADFLCASEACPFVGSKFELLTHQGVCLYAMQKCEYCGFILMRQLLGNHLNVCEGSSKKRDSNPILESRIRELEEENRQLKRKLIEINSNTPQDNSFTYKKLNLIDSDENCSKQKLQIIESLINFYFENNFESIEKVCEQVQANLNKIFGSSWIVLIYNKDNLHYRSNHFNNESFRFTKGDLSIVIFRSAKVNDGEDAKDDFFEVERKSKGISDHMFLEIKGIVKDVKKNVKNLKERAEAIEKAITSKFGEFWCVILGGHFSKALRYFYDQYIEFHYSGLTYIMFRSSPGVNILSGGPVEVIQKGNGVDQNMILKMKEIVLKACSKGGSDLYSRSEYITGELNKQFGNYWACFASIIGSAHYSYFNNQFALIKCDEIQFNIFRSSK